MGWSVKEEDVGATGWKWCNRMGDIGTAGTKGTESWGLAAKWERLTWGLFWMGVLEMEEGAKGKDGEDGVVGVGGTEAEGGCNGSWRGVGGLDLAGDAGSVDCPGSGMERVAWRGLGTVLGLEGSVCVLLSSAGGGPLFGASELGVGARGAARLGADSGDWQGLELGDCKMSGV